MLFLRNYILVALISLFSYGYGQNLVPNPSFEQAFISSNSSYNYHNFDSVPVSCWASPTIVGGLVCVNEPYFHNGYYFHSYDICPDELIARTGNAKIIIRQTNGNLENNLDSTYDSRSYLQTKLMQPLVAGQDYFFKMYVSGDYFAGGLGMCGISCTKNLGVHFSVDRPLDLTTEKRMDLTPQLSFNGIEFYNQPHIWIALSGVYTAMGGERYLTIGNFDYFRNTVFQNGSPLGLSPLYVGNECYTQAWLGIDDVSLIPLGSTDTTSLSTHIGNDTTVCGSVDLTLTAPSGFSYYLWSNGSHEQSIHVTQPGSYWCKMDEECAFCSDTVTINLQEPKSIDLGNDTTFCAPSDFLIQLYAGLGYSSYLWNTGYNGTTLYTTEPGTYWVKTNYLCGTVTDTIHIREIVPPDAPLTFDTTICMNDVVSLHAEGQNLLWYNSANDTEGNPLSPDVSTNNEGVYTYFVSQSIEICESDLAPLKLTVVAPPYFNLEDTIRVCDWEAKEIGPNNPSWTYSWNDESVISPKFVSKEGVYILNANNQCGNHSDETLVFVEDCRCYFYLPNTFTPNGDAINNEYKPVYDCELESFELFIYDRWEKLIFHSTDPNKAWDGSFKNSDLQDGIYAVRVVYKSLKDHKEKDVFGYVLLMR